MTSEPALSCLHRIEFSNVSVTRGQMKLLDNVNLEMHCQELTGLIGRNGAGKTTLLRAILGEIPYTGTIAYRDGKNAAMLRPSVGYVPQQLLFDKSMPVTVEDFLLTGQGRYPVWMRHGTKRRKKAQDQLDRLHCAHLLQRKLGELSGGELQRVLLAMAIGPAPELLILDEPVSGIDITGLDLFYETVAELCKTHHMAILLVSHDFSLLRRYVHKTVLLEKTVLAAGRTEDVFATSAFQRVFGATT